MNLKPKHFFIIFLILLFAIQVQADAPDVYHPIITSDPSLSATVFATDGTTTMDIELIDGRLHVSDSVHGVKNLRVLESMLYARVDGYNGKEVMLYHVNDAGVKDSSRLVPIQSDGTWTYFYDVEFSEVIIDGFVGTWEVTAYNLSVSDSLNFGQTFNASNVTSLPVNVTDDASALSKYGYIESTNPILWLPFDDNYTDMSGNGNNGTAYGGNISFVDGKYENCSEMNETSKITIDSSNIFNVSENLTVVFWIDNYKLGARSIVLSKANGVSELDSSWWFDWGEWVNDDKIRFKLWNNTNSSRNAISNSIPSGYHQIIGSYERLGGNNNLKIYVNNELHGSATQTGSIKLVDTPVMIGSIGVWDGSLDGKIDNVLMYNRILSESERNNLYYDHLQQLQIKTNSNSTWSSEWNSTADNPIQVPYADGELFSLLNFTVPDTVVQYHNGEPITIHDYPSTVKFDAIATVGYTEDITKITESATAGTYTLNITHAAGNTGEGYINYTTTNAVLLDADFWNAAVLTTDNPNASLSTTLPNFNISTGYVAATTEYYYLVEQDYFYPPQNLASIPDVDHIHFDWDDYNNVDFWNISRLDLTIPFTPAYPILDGIEDACYECCCAYGFVGDAPNPYTDYGKELIYILRNSTYLMLYADGEDNDAFNNDDEFIIGIDASNNNLSTDDRKFILKEGGTVTAKQMTGAGTWIPIATNAQGVVVGGGTPGAIQYEMFIPVSELDTNFTNGSTVKFFMSRTHTASNPDIESYYPQTLINTTDATLWQSVLLSSEAQYTYINNTTISEYNMTGLDPFTWYQHAFTAINGSQESSGVNSADITSDVPSYSIEGYIKDPDGNPINNASVWLQNGFVQTFGYSNESGYYSAIHIHAGNYTIYANKTCYVENSIDIFVNDNLTNQNITLANVVVNNCELMEKLLEIEDAIDDLSTDFTPTEGNYEMLSSTYNIFLLLLGACFILAFPKRGEVTERDTGLNNVLFSFLGTILAVFLAQIIVSGQVVESFAFESQIYDPLQHYFLYLIAVIMFVVFVLNVVYYVRQRID